MPIFGLPTAFAFGIDSLAHLTGATVVPLAIGAEAGGALVVPRYPFAVQANDAHERGRVADLMRRHIETTIRNVPNNGTSGRRSRSTWRPRIP